MKKILLLLVFVLFPMGNVFAGSQVNITKDGLATVSDARVMQLAGSTLYTRLYWGDAFVRFMVKTNSSTKFYRGTGESTTISEIIEGNLLEITGELESGSNTLIIVASSIKNSSVQKQQNSFSGKVVSVDVAQNKFVLNTGKNGEITVATLPTTTFVKGNRSLSLSSIKVGDTIIKTGGDYDFSTKTLTATSVITFVDMKMYKAKNYEGVIVEVPVVSNPDTMKVNIGGLTYSIIIKNTTSILSNNKKVALITRFEVGDKVRLYGTLREIDDLIIDAEIIRNQNL